MTAERPLVKGGRTDDDAICPENCAVAWAIKREYGTLCRHR